MWTSAVAAPSSSSKAIPRRLICGATSYLIEAIGRPLSRAEWPKAIKPVFAGFRSPAGDKMALEDNVFIEQVLPGAIMRNLTEAEMTRYRAPFLEPGEAPRPTLSWPRQIPLDGEPENEVAIVEAYSQWLRESELPRLFINANPGAILRGAPREFCRSWPNQTEATVSGTHFIEEDSPDEIGQAIADRVSTSVRQ